MNLDAAREKNALSAGAGAGRTSGRVPGIDERAGIQIRKHRACFFIHRSRKFQMPAIIVFAVPRRMRLNAILNHAIGKPAAP